MMSADNQNMDLGLALGYSNNCTTPRMNVNSGAGVNARSSVNLKFPASDSLSELVWSPHKGLSLKCTEGSLADKKSFLLWNVGPSNVDPSPSQSIGCTVIDDDKIVEGNLVIHQAELHFDSEAAERASLIESPKNGLKPQVGSSHGHNLESKREMEGGKIEEGFLTKSGIQIAQHLGGNEKEECDLLKEQMDYMPESSKNDTGQLIPNLSLQGPPDAICDMAKAEALSGNLIKDIPSDLNLTNDDTVIGCQIMEEGTTAAQVNIQIQSEAHSNPLCLDVSTKEVKVANEEERKKKFSTHGYMGPAVEKLEYTAENDLQHMTMKDAYQQSEERLMRGSSVFLETNAENRSSHFHQLEGKDKALSEGNVSRRFSDDEDDSQETVESCNSACLLVKKRWNFSEQLMVESKRMKKNINGNTTSTSIIKHDSSFVNWISNMVKGFSKSNHDGPSLDLTLAHSCHEDTSTIQENVTCSRQQEPISRNTGFQTIFQSLYRPNTKPLEAGTLENDCSAQGLQDFMQVEKTDVQISPNSFSGQNGVSCHDKITLDEKILASVTEDIRGQSDQPLILSAISPIQNDIKTDSTESKDLSNKECCKDKDGTSASVYLADHRITTTEIGNPQLASDGRAALSNKGNLYGSSWITRFTTKVCSTSLNLSNSNKDDSQVIQCPDDCKMPNPQTQNSSEFPKGEKYPDNGVRSNENSGDLGNESQAFAANAESSLGSKEIQENNHYSVQPSHIFRTSEAMASTFARRLDALKNKHIRPTVLENDASSQMPTCFFCGKSSHNLQACSKVTETELMDLLRNKQKSCFVDKEDNLRVAACDGEMHCINTSDENPMSNGKKLLGNRSSGLNEMQNQNKSNSLENKTREHQTLPLINMVMMDGAEVPKGVFDAVRRLQLSRADILKWINSNVSLSHLEGLFLRLRLGKWEAGLGGTGYHVACITVEQSGEPLKDPKKSISVNVGGMKCLVGSQYISNHDFSEDELMVWWCRILKSGVKVPSKEDLESKFKQRITLGF